MIDKLEEKKRNSLLLKVLIIIAGLVVVYSVYLIFFTNERDSSKTIRELTESLINERFATDNVRNSSDREIIDKLIPFEMLIDIIAGYEANLQEQYNKMKKELEKFDIERILSNTIDYPDSISAESKKLLKIEIILNVQASNFRLISANTAMTIKMLKMDDPSKQPLIDSIYQLIVNGDHNIKNYFMIQDSIVKHIAKLQTFLSDNKGEYKLVGEEVRFKDKKDQNIFTRFGNRLLDLWQREKESLIRIKQQEGIVDEKIHSEIEKYL
jgi:hypothetical protein